MPSSSVATTGWNTFDKNSQLYSNLYLIFVWHFKVYPKPLWNFSYFKELDKNIKFKKP